MGATLAEGAPIARLWLLVTWRALDVPRAFGGLHRMTGADH
jgi:hypothetical protein